MTENLGNVLPVYVVADESLSMSPVVDELNAGLAALHRALLREPMAAAKVRFTILGFSEDVQVRLSLADLRTEEALPTLTTRTRTNYGAAFQALSDQLPKDINDLKAAGYAVYRPAVFFLTDGQPSDEPAWRTSYATLTDRAITKAAPNIIACGIGEAQAHTIVDIATRPEFAFVATPGTELGLAIAEFSVALTKSIVASARAAVDGQTELVVERPNNFVMAIDVV
ncbi:vWA domain-containing protein [Actinophytocola sediminis]